MSSLSPAALGEFSVSFPDVPYEDLAALIAEAIELVRDHGIKTSTHGFATDVEGPEDQIWLAMSKLGPHFRAKGYASFFLQFKIAVSPARHQTLDGKIESVTKILKN